MKDIVEKIDEIFAPFMKGLKGGKTGGKTKPLPAGARFGKLDDLYLEVVYHKTLSGMEAAEDVIKKHKLDRKTAKLLKKKVKSTMR